jgi:hypothetical protein
VNRENERKSEGGQNITWPLLNLVPAAQPPSEATGSPIAGEYELTEAVLRGAIREYQKLARYQSHRAVRLFQDVDQWFSADDHQSCFSFINVCRILDLEPTYIRTGLKMWRERTCKPADQHECLRD